MDSLRYQTAREFEHFQNIKQNVNEQFQELCKMQKEMRDDMEKWRQQRVDAEIALETINELGLREQQKLENLKKECLLVKRNLRELKKEAKVREILRKR